MTEYSGEMCEYELLRERNIKENLEKLKELGLLNSEFSQDKLKPVVRAQPRKILRERKSENLITQRRRSKRLSAQYNVKFSDDVSKLILGDSDSCYVSLDSSMDDIIPLKPLKVRSTKSITRSDRNNLRDIVPADAITDEDLKNIVKTFAEKVYDTVNGTTCHQCRQKTTDQKTHCRSSSCVGVRGQFCGPCLLHRYGESVAEALKDPEWSCPVCRGMCNCSICRNRAGKMPTGQLVNFAKDKGYNSVRELLEREETD